MELWLIRHGAIDSVYNAYDPQKKTADPPLSPKGVRQAHALADRFSDISFERIVTSDLKRAVHTATILAAGRETCVEQDAAFREIDMGALYRAHRWSDYPALHREWLTHEQDTPYPEGENGADVWARCKEPLLKLTDGACSRVALVCHGGIIRTIVCGLLDIPQQKRHFLGEPLMNCSVSILAVNGAVTRLHTFNDYSHLKSIT